MADLEYNVSNLNKKWGILLGEALAQVAALESQLIKMQENEAMLLKRIDDLEKNIKPENIRE